MHQPPVDLLEVLHSVLEVWGHDHGYPAGFQPSVVSLAFPAPPPSSALSFTSSLRLYLSFEPFFSFAIVGPCSEDECVFSACLDGNRVYVCFL